MVLATRISDYEAELKQRDGTTSQHEQSEIHLIRRAISSVLKKLSGPLQVGNARNLLRLMRGASPFRPHVIRRTGSCRYTGDRADQSDSHVRDKISRKCNGKSQKRPFWNAHRGTCHLLGAR